MAADEPSPVIEVKVDMPFVPAAAASNTQVTAGLGVQVEGPEASGDADISNVNVASLNEDGAADAAKIGAQFSSLPQADADDSAPTVLTSPGSGGRRRRGRKRRRPRR